MTVHSVCHFRMDFSHNMFFPNYLVFLFSWLVYITMYNVLFNCCLIIQTLGHTGISREFRVVRDNRVNRNMSRDLKPASPQRATSGNEKVISSVSGKG